jgi:amino-acid N-acetyltransferase
MDGPIEIAPATIRDAAAISLVLRACRDEPSLFQKPAAAVALSIDEFFVARDGKGEIIGCIGLHLDAPELAEIYAAAALPKHQGQGVGRRLVAACIERATDNRVGVVWLATMKAKYFARYGFQPMSQWELPRPVLRRKLRMVFEQPVGRWPGALFGRYTFMRRILARA